MEQELADILREMYDTAPEGEKGIQGLLFGIQYAAELDAAKQAGYSIATIRKLSRVKNYERDIGKGVKLAKYVKLKQ